MSQSSLGDRSLLDHLPSPTFRVGPDWRIAYCNLAAATVAGRPVEALLGASVWEALPGLVGTEHEARLRALLGTPGTGSWQAFVGRRQRWYEVEASADAHGLLSTFRDVTDRVVARRVLELEREVAAACGDAPDLRTALSDCARALARCTGWSFISTWAADPVHRVVTCLDVVVDDTEALRPVADAAWGLDAEVRARAFARIEAFSAPLIIDSVSVLTDSPELDAVALAAGQQSLVVLPFAGDALVPSYLIALSPARPGEDPWHAPVTQLHPQLRAALRGVERRTHLRRLFDRSFDLLAVVDGSMRLRLVNPAVADMLGGPLERLTNADALGFVHPEDRALVISTFQGMVAGAPPVELLVRIRAADGSVRDVAWLGAWVADDQLMYLVGRDLTERRALARLLDEERSRYRLLMELSSDCIYEWNIAEDTIAFNEGLTQHFGQPQGAVASVAAWAELIHPEDRARIERSLAAAIDSGASRWEDEYRFRRSDGQWAEVRDQGYLLRDRRGQAHAMIGGMTDVSDRRRRDREAQRRMRTEAVGTLAGGIAHDLNNALAPLLSSIELLRMEQASGTDEELLSLIETSAQKAADLVRRMMHLSRGARAEPVATPVAALLEDVAAALRLPAHAEVVVSCPPSLMVLADGAQLRQALQHLAENGAEALGPFGRIRLRAEPVDDATGRPVVRLSVEDDGAGMEPDVREHVTDPFFGTRGRSGLGAAMAAAIVRAHRGTLTFHSAPGEGTVAVIDLPRPVAAAAAAPTSGARAAPVSGGGERILVVDDEVGVLRTLTRLLARFGYTPLPAGSPAEALEHLRMPDHGIRLVLTDLTMPGTTGSSFVATLRREAPTVPVVVSSGYAADANDPVLRDLPFIPKPYGVEELRQQVARAIASTPL